ncbi:hypothetical protein ACF0H5_014599 [Mactra antiquata]
MDDFEELNKIYEDHFKPNIFFKEQTENIVISVTDINLNSDDEDIELINSPITNKLTETCDSDYDDDNDENLCETNTSISVDDVIHNYNSSCSKNCLALFSKEDVKEHFYNLREYERCVKDAYIMGALNKISSNDKRCKDNTRKRYRYEYKFNSTQICRRAFKLIYDIGNRTLKNLIKHINENGNILRIHGNKGKRPKHSLSFEDAEQVVKYIIRYADENGIPQPAAPRGRDENVVNKSSKTTCAIRYGATWEWRDWKNFFMQNFKALHGIRDFFSFHVTASDPGYVFVSKESGLSETRVQLCSHSLITSARPSPVPAAGLSISRQLGN